MTKKIFQDVVPPGEKKGIRNIPVPDRTLRSRFVSRVNATHSNEATTEEETKENISGDFEHGRKIPSEKRKWPLAPVILFFVLVLLIATFFTATIFGSTTVRVVRHNVLASYDKETISIDYGGDKSIAKPLSFELTASEKVPALDEENVAIKSSGKIIIYNNYSAQSQKLVKNTRFEAANKKIYRIADSITVPGQKKVDGKTVPGSIEVTIYADTEGEEYNIDMSDFTVPGFSGTPRFSSIYARSKTPMVGGFKGVIKKVSAETINSAKTNMQKSIQEKIENEISSKIPENYMFLINQVKIVYKDLPQSEQQKDSVVLNMKADITVPIFERIALSRLIAEKYFDESLSKESPSIEDFSTLTFSTPDISQKDGKGQITFRVTGDTRVIWPMDEILLKAKIAGSKRNNISQIFSEHKTISKAKAYVKPFWKTSFSKDVKKINIEFVDEL